MRKIFKLALFILFLSVIVLTQFFFDEAKAKQQKPSPLVLNSKIIENLDLGLHSAASDMLWLSAIQYFGDWQSDHYEKLDDYLQESANLDPKFSHIYEFSALSLPSVGMTDTAIDLAHKGLENDPGNWHIPYYLAMTYYMEKKDYENAAKYFDLAANTKGAPSGIKAVAASFASRPDLRSNIKQIWVTVYETSNDDVIREKAKAYVYHYELLDLLENAATIYKNKFGSFPSNPEDLVQKNILKDVPTDPFGFEYIFDEDGRAEIKQ